MNDNRLNNAVLKAWEEKRRLVAPLLGFPGLTITGSNIKLAQQNYSEHFKLVKNLAEKFAPDVVFPLMDLSVEANALGRYTLFPREESATVEKEPFDFSELEQIKEIDIRYDTRLLGYVETVKMMSEGIDPSILKGAYISGPYTLAALIMGAEDTALATIMNPEQLHFLIKTLLEKIIAYVDLLIRSGAQIICVLEPSAVMLSPETFTEFSGKYTAAIVEFCKEKNISTVYHICGNTMHLVDKMCDAGVDALSLDSNETGVDLIEVAGKIPGSVSVIGNLSPVGTILNGSEVEVEKETLALIKAMDEFPNFILSTGCDLPQNTPLKNIRAFIEAGRKYAIPR